MKRSKLREVTIVTEFYTELPFRTHAKFPMSENGLHSDGKAAE
jgi:hypothetical protein